MIFLSLATPGVSHQALPAGSTLPTTAQDAIGHPGSEDTLLTHVQLDVS